MLLRLTLPKSDSNEQTDSVSVKCENLPAQPPKAVADVNLASYRTDRMTYLFCINKHLEIKFDARC